MPDLFSLQIGDGGRDGGHECVVYASSDEPKKISITRGPPTARCVYRYPTPSGQAEGTLVVGESVTVEQRVWLYPEDSLAVAVEKG